MTCCQFPVKGPGKRQQCGHRAVVAYKWPESPEPMPRCRRHDSPQARGYAAFHGYLVEPVAT